MNQHSDRASREKGQGLNPLLVKSLIYVLQVVTNLSRPSNFQSNSCLLVPHIRSLLKQQCPYVAPVRAHQQQPACLGSCRTKAALFGSLEIPAFSFPGKSGKDKIFSTLSFSPLSKSSPSSNSHHCIEILFLPGNCLLRICFIDTHGLEFSGQGTPGCWVKTMNNSHWQSSVK